MRNIRRTGGLAEAGRFLKAWARFPVIQSAEMILGALPQLTLTDVLPGEVVPDVSLERILADTGTWSLNLTERLLVSVIVRARQATRIFEIGTFNGGTTRMLAELVGEDGEVVTLDLPEAAFNATQRPGDFRGSDVGRAYRGTAVEARITQIRTDSLAYDPTEYEATIDIVLVDGAHDYVHGFADTRTALRLVKPGGVVLWDDFEPYWAGLIHGITDAMGARSLGRLQGSALGVHVAPEGRPATWSEVVGADHPRVALRSGDGGDVGDAPSSA